MRLAKRLGLRRILVLARAEVLHVVRDRATLAQLIVVPLVQLLVLSNAATFAIRATPAYVVDFDHTSTSRGLVSRLGSSGYFRIVGESSSPEAGSEAMLRGRATLVLTIPRDFEESLVRTRSAPVHLDVNAIQGSAAGIVQSYATRVIAAYGDELGATLHPTARLALAGADGDGPPPARGAGHLELRARGWYNPTLDYRHYMVPGILVALVTIVGTLITAQNIAREKEAGTLEQLNVTPITRGQFIAAKLLPFWVLGMIDLGLGLAVGWLAFGIPVRGSIALLFGAAAVYLMVALAIGLWISTLVETQQQAMFVTFFVLMVYLLMSGLLTPIDSMPAWVQWLSELNPVRHFVTITRAILMKGAGIREIAAPLLTLGVFAVVALWLAVRQYAKRAA
ncbi:MAG TPA: ABC transporter permease [Gemmatimonadaceae bacterium]|nr:ABC transporter permease [Gemmatimonadaceae bacterium]